MEEQINKLKEIYKIVFESDHGKEVMKDLEKRCHDKYYHLTSL